MEFLLDFTPIFIDVTLNMALLEINPQPYNIQGGSVPQLNLEKKQKHKGFF